MSNATSKIILATAAFAAGGALIAIASCAVTPKPTQQQSSAACLDSHNVLSLRPNGDRAIVVVTNGNKAYELGFATPCVDATVELRPKLISHTGQWVCGAGDADVIYPGHTPMTNQSCKVVSVRPLSGDEAAKWIKG